MRTVDNGMASFDGMPLNMFSKAPPDATPLGSLENFGTNPGQLRARTFVPHGVGAGAPLVVVLHGCTQSAAGYDRGAGWSQVAEEFGFALLYPEQQRSNNANLCFNWFEPDDMRRDGGEALSIRQMIFTMIEREGLDRGRVFVTGLSAGGAMTAVMLAAYPELFAGGAIIAGLPFGSASSVPEALAKMRSGDRATAGELAAQVASASRHKGRRPTVSVWHGTADRTVHPANGDAIVAQWRAVLDLPDASDSSTVVGNHRRTAWRDKDGREMLEFWEMSGMGHGTPLATSGPDACGQAQPHMLDAGISSTREIARFWKLCPPASSRDDVRTRDAAPPPPRSPHDVSGVGRVIEDALRAAGLMR